VPEKRADQKTVQEEYILEPPITWSPKALILLRGFLLTLDLKLSVVQFTRRFPTANCFRRSVFVEEDSVRYLLEDASVKVCIAVHFA
jgi:hypothetical protein